MTSPLPPQGGLSDDQLLGAPGPTDDQLLAAPGPSDDALLAAPGPAAGAAHPGLGSRLLGIGERGMVGGALGVAGAVQSAGRWLDNHTQNILPALNTPAADNVDLQAIGDRALDRDHAYKPQEASGKILEGAVAGATGAVLSGGAGAVPLAASTAAGLAAPTARALGASDDTANDIAFGVGLLPIAGAGAAAGARAASGAVRSNLVGRAAASMTDDQAIQTAMLDDAVRQYAAAGTGNNRLAQQVAGYKKNLANAVGDYASAAKGAGLVDGAGARDIGNAGSQASAGTNGLTNAPGAALPTVRALGLPDAHQEALEGALGQLDAASGQQFGRSAAGPMTAAVTKLAPVAGYGSALLAGLHGNFGEAASIASGTALGTHIPGILPKIGQSMDRLLGTDVPAFAWNADAARRAIADRGLQLPDQNPLLALQGATSDANQLAAANAQFAEASKLNDQFDRAQDGDWQDMLRQAYATNQQASQIDRAHQAMQADMARQAAQQQAEGIRMNAQFDRGQQANDRADWNATLRDAYGTNTEADKIEASRQAMQADLARRQNTADAAGNWMERQARIKFQRDNPGVPITGAAQLLPGADVFEATGGRYGSPAGATGPGVAGVTQPVPGGSPSGPPAAPAPAPQAPAAAPSQTPGLPTSMGPPSPFTAPSGGQVLTQQVYRDLFPGRALPDTPDIHRAVGALGSQVDPLEGFKAISGMSVSRDTAYQLARHLGTNDAEMASRAAAIPSQATAEVSSLMGGSSMLPNGGDRGAIQNLPRWQAAGQNYQRHAANMMTLAKSPAEKQAISQIAATAGSAGKQAVLDEYQRNNPGADLSRFTPQLMKGI